MIEVKHQIGRFRISNRMDIRNLSGYILQFALNDIIEDHHLTQPKYEQMNSL